MIQLDTSAYIEFIKGTPKGARVRDRCEEQELCVSAVTANEIYAGEEDPCELELLEHDGTGVLAHGVRSAIGRMIAVHNFTGAPVRTRVDIGEVEPGTTLLDLHGPGRIAVDGARYVEFELAPYGFHWMRISPPGDTRIG